jgi:chromosome segregation ATPase
MLASTMKERTALKLQISTLEASVAYLQKSIAEHEAGVKPQFRDASTAVDGSLAAAGAHAEKMEWEARLHALETELQSTKNKLANADILLQLGHGTISDLEARLTELQAAVDKGRDELHAVSQAYARAHRRSHTHTHRERE